MQAGGAADGWSDHSGHLSDDDFSAETPVATEASAPPTFPPTGVPVAGPAVSQPPSAGRSNLLPWVVIGALLVLVLILVAALNLRDYHLVQRGETVEVRRGGWLPGTTRAMELREGMVGRRYAPIKLPKGSTYRSRRFTEREDLDAGLIDLFIELLGGAVRRSDQDRVELLGARLELFPSAAHVLEGKHEELLRAVGRVRGRRAELEALNAVHRARDLYRRYRRSGDAAIAAAIDRLQQVEVLLGGAAKSLRMSDPREDRSDEGTDF